MRKKTKILIGTYAIAVIAALGIYSFVSHGNLADYRLAAKYSSNRAFEETVNAVSALSASLEKSVYATDGGMCSKICSEAYANALAAEAAMSTLPFSNYELEQIAGFLNVAGDYAYTLSAQAAEEGFTQQQLKTLSDMSATAAELTGSLLELQESVHGGGVIMDSRELRLENVGTEQGTEKLSAKLLQYEAEFRPQAELEYDGKYGGSQQAESAQLRLTEEEMLKLAAEFAGVDKSELKKEYDYQGESGRRCYSAGELMICVSPSGVESMSQSRLVSEGVVSSEQALEKAEEFLRAHGYENLQVTESSVNGAIAAMSFARVENEAVCLDDTVKVSVALDDGSIYSFNAAGYSSQESGAEWTVDEETAAEKLPESLKALDSRKVIIRSPGGSSQGCYEFSCEDKSRRQVKIYVDAATGKQCRIVMGEKQGSQI